MQDLLYNGGTTGIDVQIPFQRMVASIIHTLLYGFRVKDYNDPVLRAVFRLNDEFSQFLHVGAHIVDQFPILNNLPGFLAPWKAKADNHYSTKYTLRHKNFRRGVESGTWNISKLLLCKIGRCYFMRIFLFFFGNCSLSGKLLAVSGFLSGWSSLTCKFQTVQIGCRLRRQRKRTHKV